MVQRMPTPEEQAALIQAIYGYLPGKTQANRFNYLQDISGAINFDPFGLPYAPEMFPEEDMISQIRLDYASDPASPYAGVFDAVDSGQDPISAARAAIARGDFGDPLVVRDDRLDEDIKEIAQQYRRELNEIPKRMREFDREQARAAREAPVTLEEILNPASQYEIASMAAGKPEGLTEQDLLAGYSRRRFEQAQAGRTRGLEQRAARESATPAAQAKPGKKSRVNMGGLLRTVGRAIGNVPLPSTLVGGAAVRAASNAPLVRGVDAAMGIGRGNGSPVAMAAPGRPPTPQLKVADYAVRDDPNSIHSLIARDAARRALQSQRETPVWRPEAQQVLRQLNYLNLLNQGGG